MNDKIIQIIPAPANMLYAFEDGKTYPVACLALVELSNGDREVHAMGTINSGPIEDVSDSGAVLIHVLKKPSPNRGGPLLW